MIWIEQKYAKLAGQHLLRFRPNGQNFQCRCPFCGDSKTNKLRARGYLILDKGRYGYYCHNCGVSMPFKSFLKHVNTSLYEEFLREVFIEQSHGFNQAEPVKAVPIENYSWPRYLLDSPIKQLKKISQLRYDHPAKRYVEKRKIPNKMHGKLFYAPNFNGWVNSFMPDKLPEDKKEPRLVIPFVDKHNNLIGFTGRAFGPEELRYSTIMIDKDVPQCFGYDSVDLRKTTYIVEGPIDSMFLDNAIAMAGSNFLRLAEVLNLDPKTCIVVFDNEPRNKEIAAKMKKALKKGWRVCIWPKSVQEKDINDMVLAGTDIKTIHQTINENVVEGLTGLVRLQEWKKN